MPFVAVHSYQVIKLPTIPATPFDDLHAASCQEREAASQAMREGATEHAPNSARGSTCRRMKLMRRCHLGCYDVRNDTRLRRIHKLMKAYGEPWEYSVVYCTLKAVDRVRLENSAREVLNLKEDPLLLVDLGSNEEPSRERAIVLGDSLPDAESGTVVI